MSRSFEPRSNADQEYRANAYMDEAELEQESTSEGPSLDWLRQNNIQPKLAISPPDDPMEREADEMAKQVVQQMNTNSKGSPLQNQPKKQAVQLKVQGSTSSSYASDAISSKIQQTKGMGNPLSPQIQNQMEQGFGASFNQVRIHTDGEAINMNQQLGARAFTHGLDIYFNESQYNPDSIEGKKLLAHELVHTLQQKKIENFIQKQENDLPTQNLKIFIIGSPSPGEIRASHPYQFVNAAIYRGIDSHTIWIVERTGYDEGGVNLSFIENSIKANHLFWLTPQSNLASILNHLPPNSISEFTVFSHGVPGQVTLRYGWASQNLPNYGLNLSNVRNISDHAFTEDTRVVFDSCNTGTSDWYSPEGNLAQQFADTTGTNVEAWTGRTSYTEVNDGAEDGRTEVVASERMRGIHVDGVEILSQDVLGREPRRQTFSPAYSGTRVGGFDSHFQIRRRLPSTRDFKVPNGGAVVVTCPNPELQNINPQALTKYSEYTPYGTAMESQEDHQARISQVSGEFWVALYRKAWGPDSNLGMHTFPVASNNEVASWSNLEEGTYYVEIYRLGGNSNYPVRSEIHLDVYQP